MTKSISLNQIHFPVFWIAASKPTIENGVVLYFQIVRDDDTHEERYTYQIVDDTNQPGETLAARRLQLMMQGVNLKKLSKAIFFLGDLVKIAKPYHWFIDSSGQVFNYRKQQVYKLVFKRIVKMIPIQTGGAILEIDGFNERFKCLYTPKLEDHYAGVLKYGTHNILYGVYNEKQLDTHRKV